MRFNLNSIISKHGSKNLNNKINTFYKFDKTYYNSRSVQIQINLIYIEYISNNYFNLITTTKPPSF